MGWPSPGQVSNVRRCQRPVEKTRIYRCWYQARCWDGQDQDRYQTSAGVQDPLRKPGYTDVGIRLGVGWQRPGLCQTFSGSTICGEGQNNADVGITFGVEWQRPGGSFCRSHLHAPGGDVADWCRLRVERLFELLHHSLRTEACSPSPSPTPSRSHSDELNVYLVESPG